MIEDEFEEEEQIEDYVDQVEGNLEREVRQGLEQKMKNDIESYLKGYEKHLANQLRTLEKAVHLRYQEKPVWNSMKQEYQFIGPARLRKKYDYKRRRDEGL